MKKEKVIFLLLLLLIILSLSVSKYFDYDKYPKEEYYREVSINASNRIIDAINMFSYENNRFPKNEFDFIDNKENAEYFGFKKDTNVVLWKRNSESWEVRQLKKPVPKDIELKCTVENFIPPIKIFYYIKIDKKDNLIIDKKDKFIYIGIRFRDSSNRFLFSEKYNKLFGFENKFHI